jgi:hypothetical protein
MKITEHDVKTGKIIERDMTADEIEKLEKAQNDYVSAQDAKDLAKAALLERLGITDDEAKLLLG